MSVLACQEQCKYNKKRKNTINYKEKRNIRRFKTIGASECLERDRGPGGPPSDWKERFRVAK